MRIRGFGVALALALAATSARADVSRRVEGDWTVGRDVAALDGRSTYIAATSSTNEVRDANGLPARAQLNAVCMPGGKLAAFVTWPDFVSLQPVLVEYRVDQVAGRGTWEVGTGGTSTGYWRAADARRLLATLASGEALVVQAGGREAVFGIKGAAEVVPRLLAVCS